ncbi:MAG: hypothetical protein ACRDK4_03075 [Solirubrobacteraceae bacterium]
MVILLIALVALGAVIYAVAAWLRLLKLDPQRDKIEGASRAEQQDEQSRPRHVRHGRSQRVLFTESR